MSGPSILHSVNNDVMTDTVGMLNHTVLFEIRFFRWSCDCNVCPEDLLRACSKFDNHSPLLTNTIDTEDETLRNHASKSDAMLTSAISALYILVPNLNCSAMLPSTSTSPSVLYITSPSVLYKAIAILNWDKLEQLSRPTYTDIRHVVSQRDRSQFIGIEKGLSAHAASIARSKAQALGKWNDCIYSDLAFVNGRPRDGWIQLAGHGIAKVHQFASICSARTNEHNLRHILSYRMSSANDHRPKRRNTRW